MRHVLEHIPANFFWVISMRLLSWEFWDFCTRHDHFRRFPKSSEVCRRWLSRKRLSTKSEIARKVLLFIHFTHGFRSLHGSELTYFWKLCQARRQQVTFFNQTWEIGPLAWDSHLRRESWQVYITWHETCYNITRHMLYNITGHMLYNITWHYIGYIT